MFGTKEPKNKTKEEEIKAKEKSAELEEKINKKNRSTKDRGAKD